MYCHSVQLQVNIGYRASTIINKPPKFIEHIGEFLETVITSLH